MVLKVKNLLIALKETFMNEEIDVIFREAIPEDAESILLLLDHVSKETPYLLANESNQLTIEEEAEYLLMSNHSMNSLLLVASIEKKTIGMASITASKNKRIDHIGDIGISVLKEYWGFGLGTELMEGLVDWASKTSIIRRLELTVQDRNKRAISLYEKVGFETEAIMHRGAKTDDGELIDVRLMSRLIN